MTTPAGSGVTNKGTTYANGSQITSTNLNDIVDDAVFNTNAVDDSTIGLNSSTPKALFVKDAGIDTAQIKDDAVDKTKIDFIADDLATTDTHILIADGTDFHNKAISGDITITNAGVASISASTNLPDGVDAVTQSAGNNTTKVATTEFVTTAVTNVTQIAKYTLTNQTDFNPPNDGTVTLALTETSDPFNLATVSSDTIVIGGGAGLYVVALDADVRQSQSGSTGSNKSHLTFNFIVDGTTLLSDDHDGTTSFRRMISTAYLNLSDSDVIKLDAVSSGADTGDSRGSIQNSQIIIQKLS